MEAADRPETALPYVLRQLTAELPPLPVPPPGLRWETALEGALSAIDRVARWRIASAVDALADASPAHPAISRTERGWWVAGLDRGSLRLVDEAGHASTLPVGAVGAESLPWAFAEPALPMSALADHHAPWRRVLALLREELPDLRSLFIYAGAAGLLGLVTPLMVQVLVNTVAFGTAQQPLYVLVVLLGAGLGAGAALRVLERYVVELLQRRLFVRTVADLASRLPRIRDEVHQRAAPTEIVNRFFDVLTAQKALSSLLLDGIDAALQTMTGLLLLAIYHPALLGFDVLMVGALLGVLFGMSGAATKTAISESKAKHAVAAWLEEIAAHPELFRGHGGSEHALQRADALTHAWLRYRSEHFGAFLRQHGTALALQVLASTGLLALGGMLVIERQLSLGQLVAAELVVASVLLAFGKLTDKLEAAYDLVAAVDKIGHVTELPRLRTTGWCPPPADGPAPLRLDGLTLTPDGPSLDLRVPAGEAVAILVQDDALGDALAAVLTGSRSPSAGLVRLDGVALDDLSLRAVRRDVALLRDGDAVSGTIAENLQLGAPHADVVRMQSALDRVGLGRREGALSDGISSRLGPMGAPLSESERVRLTVARALLGPQRAQVVDRLLDRVPPEDAAQLLAGLLDTRRTTLVLTRDRALAARLPRQLLLSSHGLTPYGGRV